jgi:Fe-S cluster assembly protein SufD
MSPATKPTIVPAGAPSSPSGGQGGSAAAASPAATAATTSAAAAGATAAPGAGKAGAPMAATAPAALRSFEALFRSREPDAWTPIRRRAFERFVELGLPTLRDESWRYTNLKPIANQSFVDAPADARVAEPDRRLVPGAPTVVLLNGRPVQVGSLNGITIRSLRDISRHDPNAVAPFLEDLADAEEARWALLNTALFVDGLHLRITGEVAEPIVILHVGSAERAGTASFARVIVEAEPGSSATVLQHHVQAGAEAPLANSATLLMLERGARVEHYRVFASGAGAVHLDSLQVRQRRDSECRQFTATLGGGLTRAWLDARLLEPGARIDSHALLSGRERRHVDCVNVVEHAARSTTSGQTARAIASGSSRVIFNSKVVVAAGASGSESRQSCRGLLLSPSAEIDSRPQLEIHTDEVKCAHGATTGRLDPNMLFYLLARGLDRATAQSLLVYAFLGDVLTGMSVASARGAIEESLIAELPDSHTLRNFR